MNRLNFSLPEFTRLAWTSERAREVWEPRIQKINSIWPLIERWTVANKLRGSALQSIAPDKLIDIQRWCFDNQQDYAILAQEGNSPIYGNATKPYDPARPWNYRVYIGTRPKEFIKYWTAGNQLKIAEHLGYPACCGEFFDNYWQKDGWRDLTYAMTGFQPKVVEGPATCNILLRHIGIRPVFHLPCSFDCPETAVIGKQILDCIDELGYHQELEWLYEMLNWPIHWSSLHGVVMITTPCLRIISSTDPLPTAFVIDRNGPEYPLEGATGTVFPFQQVVQIRSKDIWTDNGFSNRTSMRAAHDLILDAIDIILLDPGNILDLGCGNGLLLDKLHDKYEFLEPFGVEIDPDRAARAMMRHDGKIFKTNVTDVATYFGKYELILIALNRFNELDNVSIVKLLHGLTTLTRYLLVYSYEQWKDIRVTTMLLKEYDLLHAEQNAFTEARIYKPKP